MYCAECGTKGTGKFCTNCGTPLTAGPAATGSAPVGEAPASGGAGRVGPADPAGASTANGTHWQDEIVYEALLRVPQVRAAIDRAAGLAKKRQSGEEFLKSCGAFMETGVPLTTLAAVAQPAFAAMGVRTGKERRDRIDAPPGRVMLRALCSLARNGQTLRGVKQASDGCLLEAVLPSDMWAFEGDLLVTVRRLDGATEVSAATKIKGQLFDWGKSRRCLNALFADLHTDPA